MGKSKKPAKMANRSRGAADEVAASSLVILTGTGHRVARAQDVRAVCGVERVGWRYGTKEDVTCTPCSS